jgi:hypothetical protein
LDPPPFFGKGLHDIGTLKAKSEYKSFGLEGKTTPFTTESWSTMLLHDSIAKQSVWSDVMMANDNVSDAFESHKVEQQMAVYYCGHQNSWTLDTE